MEKDKLYKQATLAAYNYANPDGDDPCLDMDFYEGFIKGAEWLQSQPLSDRLTEEERERIKAKYNELKSLNSITNEMFSDDTAIFEWLFGKEMFEK